MIFKKIIERKFVSCQNSRIEEFARISSIAWAHILFTGRYRFKKNNGLIDISGIVQILEDQLKQSIWKEGERGAA